MDTWEHPRPPAGAISIEHEGADRRVLCLRGEVDTAVATQFTTTHRRERVVVDAIDADGVTFVSSSALALLLTCVEASLAAGRNPVLRAASRQVNRALQLAGIDSVFTRPDPDPAQPPAPGGATDRPA